MMHIMLYHLSSQALQKGEKENCAKLYVLVFVLLIFTNRFF